MDSLQGNDNEIKEKQEAAEKVLSEARQAAQKQIQEAKAEAQAQSDKRLNEVKSVSLPLPLRWLHDLVHAGQRDGDKAPRPPLQP